MIVFMPGACDYNNVIISNAGIVNISINVNEDVRILYHMLLFYGSKQRMLSANGF
jgi:hypothetical protein